MPYKCCVPFCKSNYPGRPRVAIFQFPKDVSLQKQWLVAIRRKDFIPTKYSKVCELHFSPECILHSTSCMVPETGVVISAKLDRKRLKPKAVPTIFNHYPGHCKSTPTKSSQTSTNHTKKLDIRRSPDSKSLFDSKIATVPANKNNERSNNKTESSNEFSITDDCSSTSLLETKALSAKKNVKPFKKDYHYKSMSSKSIQTPANHTKKLDSRRGPDSKSFLGSKMTAVRVIKSNQRSNNEIKSSNEFTTTDDSGSKMTALRVNKSIQQSINGIKSSNEFSITDDCCSTSLLGTKTLSTKKNVKPFKKDYHCKSTSSKSIQTPTNLTRKLDIRRSPDSKSFLKSKMTAAPVNRSNKRSTKSSSEFSIKDNCSRPLLLGSKTSSVKPLKKDHPPSREKSVRAEFVRSLKVLKNSLSLKNDFQELKIASKNCVTCHNLS